MNVIVSNEQRNTLSGLDIDIIKSQMREKFTPGIDVLDEVGFEKNGMNVAECDMMSKMIGVRLQYVEVYQKKDEIIRLLMDFDSNYKTDVSYYETVNHLKDVMGELLVALQESDTSQGLLKEFSFSSSNAAELLSVLCKK